MSNILDDHQTYRNIVEGRKRKELSKFIEGGSVFKLRPDSKGRVSVPVKQILQPRFVYGNPDEGVGNGNGKPGDVVGTKPGNGSKGNKPGDDHEDEVLVEVDVNEILDQIGQELRLPNMRPREKTLEEVVIKYNGLARVGPRSLLHMKKTIRECMKREIATGEVTYKKVLGSSVPVRIFGVIKDDFRFRQWTEKRIPANNAAIFFVRDGSGSMDNTKCEIVSDMAFWIDLWIKKHYKITEKYYIWHDTVAKEMSEYDFYHSRLGGGTYASSSLKYIDDEFLRNRITPDKWNIYIFYFGDGETSQRDNSEFCKIISTRLGVDTVNLMGVTEIFNYMDSGLKAEVDRQVESGKLNPNFVRTANIAAPSGGNLEEEYVSRATKQAIIDLLGANQPKKSKV